MPDRTVTLTEAEAHAVATILVNAWEQDHDTVEGDYFWFLLDDDEMTAFDLDDDRETAAERWRERFDEIRATVNSVIDKVTGPVA